MLINFKISTHFDNQLPLILGPTRFLKSFTKLPSVNLLCIMFLFRFLEAIHLKVAYGKTQRNTHLIFVLSVRRSLPADDFIHKHH